MKYEKPDLEELELALEGSFLDSRTADSGRDENELEEGEID